MSLKEELLKANLISKKELKRIEHEQRVQKTKLGKEGIKKIEKEKSAKIEEEQNKQKTYDQEISQKQNLEKIEKEKKARLRDIVHKGKVGEDGYGRRKFFFVDDEGKIPFLNLTDSLADQLARGQAAIIEYPKKCFVVVNRQSARKIKDTNPELIRFFE